MARVFEDEFMDLHSSIISLCKELVRDVLDVDMIYAYCSIEGGSYSFNAFFTVQGKAVTLKGVDVSHAMKSKFLDIGIGETRKIRELCKEFERPTPTEIKMIYNARTRQFTAEYQYKPMETMDIGIHDLFMGWVKEIDPNYGKETQAVAPAVEVQSSAPTEEPKKKPGFRFPFFGKGRK